MTKKDYKIIAEAIKRGFQDGSVPFGAVYIDIQFLMKEFQSQNPKFDKSKFLSACN